MSINLNIYPILTQSPLFSGNSVLCKRCEDFPEFSPGICKLYTFSFYVPNSFYDANSFLFSPYDQVQYETSAPTAPSSGTLVKSCDVDNVNICNIGYMRSTLDDNLNYPYLHYNGTDDQLIRAIKDEQSMFTRWKFIQKDDPSIFQIQTERGNLVKADVITGKLNVDDAISCDNINFVCDFNVYKTDYVNGNPVFAFSIPDGYPGAGKKFAIDETPGIEWPNADSVSLQSDPSNRKWSFEPYVAPTPAPTQSPTPAPTPAPTRSPTKAPIVNYSTLHNYGGYQTNGNSPAFAFGIGDWTFECFFKLTKYQYFRIFAFSNDIDNLELRPVDNGTDFTLRYWGGQVVDSSVPVKINTWYIVPVNHYVSKYHGLSQCLYRSVNL